MNIFRQALETREVQFKVPGLQTFELDLDVATAVRALPKFRWIKMVNDLSHILFGKQGHRWYVEVWLSFRAKSAATGKLILWLNPSGLIQTKLNPYLT